ncbi:hypothetical protein NDU88_006318 [Pleurodeles waltl]|uniref:Secreted protein n=1 Tax=Pleurodeles waltl TaxID=8319 RepID=A0AAV7NXS0_PLEWA|nr:hypothetical protein NDU88_006318 [Pleurodeles waltl]
MLSARLVCCLGTLASPVVALSSRPASRACWANSRHLRGYHLTRVRPISPPNYAKKGGAEELVDGKMAHVFSTWQSLVEDN